MMTTELKPGIEKAIDKIVKVIARNAPMPGDDEDALKQALRDLVSATLANR